MWFFIANESVTAAASGPSTASVQGWIALVLAVLGLAVGAGLVRALITFRDRFPESPKPAEKDFTRMLCDQVWKHTDTVGTLFTQRSRVPPGDVAALRVLVRMLREDLAGPASFVDQMRAQPPRDWPKYGLFGAFTTWSGQIKSLESQLADLQKAISYPLVKEKDDAYHDKMLIHHFGNEQMVFARAADRLRSHAFDLCAAARKVLGEDKKKGKHDDEDGEEHATCPCCRRRDEHVTVRSGGDLHFPPPPEKPAEKPKAEEAKPQFVCVCAVPQPCRGCSNGCSCTCGCSGGASVAGGRQILLCSPAPAAAKAEK
ncbi:hypothetical protein [Stakelama tenebrarum]|uniref:Uncharacterized protein n=1 Tax=Stakelama tenebrarum TaxID=2711215 RepID=A0A6G6Y739_9SPHN|nr:hypothetical protein [Sphingosinithalassobacter tenebrarum]QIG80393.1 hypothetical protein G5C33_11805 [Sphingosinithalassobacter tenebrarum]